MEKIQLQATQRPSPVAEKIRQQGLIPAIVYGNNKETQAFAISYGEFEKAYKKAGESTLIDLVVDGKPHTVIIHDTQKHYLTGKFIHVDFYEVSMTEKLKATVALEYVGVSKAVKENGGILVQVLKEIEVECLPADLPHNLEVDISALNTFDDQILIKDIKVSDKVSVLTPLDETVAKVSPPRDVEAELAEPVVEDISKVEGAAENKPVEETTESKE